jgi:hypothetical protein
LACGALPFGTRGSTKPTRVEAFFGTLRAALAELQQAYPRLQTEVSQLLLSAFGLSGPLAQSRSELTHRAKVIADLAVDAKLRSFITRVTDASSDQPEWVESVVSLLANKPTRYWNDEDRARFQVNLALTARTFGHFEALAFAAEQSGAPILDGDDTALRVSVTLPYLPDVERVVRIPTRMADRAVDVRDKIRKVLADAGLTDEPEVSAAALAQVVRELLSRNDET